MPPAETVYRVNVTRVGSDAFRDTASGVFILTFACYEYVYYEDAQLNQQRTRITFRNGDTCAVKQVSRANATLTRVSSNLYRDERTGGYVRTSMCLELALSEESLLTSDKVVFGSSGVCDRALS